MPNLPKGTEVARVRCVECGTPATAKLDKNGRAYVYCSGAFDDGPACNARHHYSTHASQKMQRDYLAARDKKPDPTPPSKEAPNERPAGIQNDTPDRQPAPSGNFDPFDL